MRARFPLGLVAMALLASAPATAEEESPAAPRGASPGEGAAPPVDLEKLLTLPDSLEYSVDRRGGATEAEWRERFREARSDLETARAALRRSQEELEEAAVGGDWKIAPPGLPAGASPESPDTHRLRQAIRRQRGEVERAERRLVDLEVEANLAGVPPEWRGPAPAPVDGGAASR